jgi:putative nucleotidyltransferase with HDIG domain
MDSDGSISLSEVISALSFALDLTEGAVYGHALRSCLLGMRIAAEIKLPTEQATGLYYALLLKDIGCSSNVGRMGQIVGEDYRAINADVRSGDTPHQSKIAILKFLWKSLLPSASPVDRISQVVWPGATEYKNSREIVTLRSDRGAGIISKLGLGQDAAEAVRCLGDQWDGKGNPDGVRGAQIPLLSRICAVAQHLDVFFAARGEGAAVQTLKERSGTWFDPELVRIAVSLHQRGTLWTDCSAIGNQDDTRQAVLDLDGGKRDRLDAGEIDRICEAFAEVVDAKSHFTFRHSQGVADVTFGIAQHMGLSAERARLVRRAALLHDIGKLSISNTILEKKSGLNAEEWKVVHRHPGLTRQILERVGPFREMSIIAGEHHEKLDGSGYPNRLMGADLSMEARMIAVADVFGALSEDRPYRDGLELENIVAIIRRLVPHKLDGDCFDALLSLSKAETAVQPEMNMADESSVRTLVANAAKAAEAAA